jgi:hypothetical protein
LVARLIEVCTGKRVESEAHHVIKHLSAHVDRRVIDECIGSLFGLDDPPKFPRYVVEVVRGRARKLSIQVPKFDPKARP